ncbi:MAG: DUF2064 domain-containing protein [Pseudomonadota bacterium]|nr:DUF2064 domain-containing protein [Pseudomonadota bacterium]
MKSSLNIFTKCPFTGNPKSRLSNFLTKEERIFLSEYMLVNILEEISTIKNISINLWVYPTYEKKFFKELSLKYKLNLFNQVGNSLYERMQDCMIRESKKFEKVILIGSDIPSLTNKFINDTISHLDKKNYVIGPSKDGGFYLLGAKEFKYRDIHLSKYRYSNYLSITKILDKKTIPYSLLMKLKDIDTKDDLLLL